MLGRHSTSSGETGQDNPTGTSSTVELLQSARAEKEEWMREKTHVRRRLVEQDQLLRSLQERVARLEKERDSIKTRVHRMLEQVDSLTQAASDGD